MSRRGVVALIAISSLAGAAATAFALWQARATNVSRAQALTLPTAAAPVASVSGTSVTLSWAQITFAGALLGTYPSGGYIVRRYAYGSSTPVTPGASCSGTIAGSATTLSCTETAVPAGNWQYTLTPALANWRGPEGVRSVVPPVNAISLTSQTGGGSYLSGTTLYYQGAALTGGSFRIQNAPTSTGSTIASSDFAALSGSSAGWTHSTPDQQTTPLGGPFISNLFAWTQGATSAPIENVTGRDSAGDQTTTALTFAEDSQAPGGGALTVNGVAANVTGTSSFNKTGSFPIDLRTDFTTDNGSGVASSILSVRFAPWSGNACGTFGSSSVIVGAPAQSASSGDGCYEFSLTGTDHVGNASQRITTVKVDRVAPVTTDNAASIGNAWRGTTQTVTLTPADSPGSGVGQTHYTTDGSTPTMVSPSGTSIVLSTTGIYTIKYFSVDNAGNQEAVKTAGTQIRIDKTGPGDVLSIASVQAAYLSGLNLYFNTNTGGSFKLVDAVTDNESGPASATFPGIGTTGWSGHTSAEVVSTGAGSAPTITYTSGTYSFAAAAGTPSGTKTISADAVGNISTGATLTYVPDSAATAPVLTFPVATSSYNDAAWNAGCSSAICGTSSDAASGVQKVEVSIQQGSGNYWNGSGFSSGTPVWNLASGTTSWSLPFAASAFPAEGSYTITPRVTDNVGNVATSSAATITVDRTAPTATNVVLANGGTAGKADKGDTIVVTYSEVMEASSFCTGWVDGSTQTKSGSSGGVVVTITNNGATDTLSLTASGCTFRFGSVALNADYVSSTSTFSGSGTNASAVSWNPATKALTITLGSASNGSQNTGIVSSTPSYTPDVAVKDLAGNAIGAGPYPGTLSFF